MQKKMIALFSAGVAGIIAFFYFLGLPQIIEVISHANALMLLASFAMEVMVLLLLGFKLGVIANGQGNLRLVKGRWSAGKYKGISFRDVFRANILGMLVSFMTPVARVGGEPVKIMILRKNGINTAASTAIVATDSFTEVFSYYMIVMLSIAFIISTGMLPMAIMVPFITIFIVSSALLVLFFVMCFRYSVLCRVVDFIRWVASRIPRRFSRPEEGRTDYAWTFYDTFTLMMTNKLFMLKAFSLSFTVKLLEFLRMYFIFAAFGYDISFVTIVLAWSIMLLVGMIPATPGGMGFVEAGGTYAYILFGIEKSVAGAVVVVDRLFSFWFVMALGMFVMSYDTISKKLRAAANMAREAAAKAALRIRNAGKPDFGSKFGEEKNQGCRIR